jgi:hypothetical protein
MGVIDSVVGTMDTDFSPGEMPPPDVGAFICIGVVLLVAFVVMFLMWWYRIHKDMAVLTYGRHSPTPGLALGLCFVPVLNLFWIPYCLSQLGKQISDMHAANGMQPYSAYTPMSLWIVGVLARLFATLSNMDSIPFLVVLNMGGMLAMLYSFYLVQDGLNKVLRQAAPT